MIPSKGLFITFEGGEGCGKSTQIHKLAVELQKRFPKTPALVTREPGGSEGAEQIRSLLTTGQPDRWLPFSEFLLFYAARYDHWTRTILPVLLKGGLVLCDRYIDSSRVYQGTGRGIPLSFFEEIHRMWAQYSPERSFWPDITFVFNLDPHKGLERSQRRQSLQPQKEDRFEQESETFHGRINQAYRDLAKNEDRVHLIDADDTIEAIHHRLLTEVFTFVRKSSEGTPTPS